MAGRRRHNSSVIATTASSIGALLLYVSAISVTVDGFLISPPEISVSGDLHARQLGGKASKRSSDIKKVKKGKAKLLTFYQSVEKFD
jgi:hypothetical protein